jgi:hypothetical protein
MFQHPAYSVQEPLVMAEADVAVVVEVRRHMSKSRFVV